MLTFSDTFVHNSAKDLTQKWPYMLPSYTHEVKTFDITFDYTIKKSMVPALYTAVSDVLHT